MSGSRNLQLPSSRFQNHLSRACFQLDCIFWRPPPRRCSEHSDSSSLTSIHRLTPDGSCHRQPLCSAVTSSYDASSPSLSSGWPRVQSLDDYWRWFDQWHLIQERWKVLTRSASAVMWHGTTSLGSLGRGGNLAIWSTWRRLSCFESIVNVLKVSEGANAALTLSLVMMRHCSIASVRQTGSPRSCQD